MQEKLISSAYALEDYQVSGDPPPPTAVSLTSSTAAFKTAKRALAILSAAGRHLSSWQAGHDH
jgi:hypothetical protein